MSDDLVAPPDVPGHTAQAIMRLTGQSWGDIDSYHQQAFSDGVMMGNAPEDMNKHLGFPGPAQAIDALHAHVAGLSTEPNFTASLTMAPETELKPADHQMLVGGALRQAYAQALTDGSAKDAGDFSQRYTGLLAAQTGDPTTGEVDPAVQARAGEIAGQIAKTLPSHQDATDYAIGLTQAADIPLTPQTIANTRANLLDQWSFGDAPLGDVYSAAMNDPGSLANPRMQRPLNDDLAGALSWVKGRVGEGFGSLARIVGETTAGVNDAYENPLGGGRDDWGVTGKDDNPAKVLAYIAAKDIDALARVPTAAMQGIARGGAQILKEAGMRGDWADTAMRDAIALSVAVGAKDSPMRVRTFDPLKPAAEAVREVPAAEAYTPDAALHRQAQIIVYHGTPHTFDAFDTSKIGTGEGAQSFGHGLYFAEEPETAKTYAQNIKPEGMSDTAHDVAREWLREASGNTNEAISNMREYIGNDRALADQVEKDIRAAAGNMYEAKITAPVEHFLDLDKPLSEQSPEVTAGLSRTGLLSQAEGGDPQIQLLQQSRTGLQALNVLERRLGKREAAAALEQNGIKGTRYFDEQSRTAAAMGPRDIPQLRESIGKAEADIKSIQNEIEINKNNPQLLPAFFKNREEQIASRQERIDQWKSRVSDIESGKGLTRNYVVFNHEDVGVVGRNGEVVDPKAAAELAKGYNAADAIWSKLVDMHAGVSLPDAWRGLQQIFRGPEGMIDAAARAAAKDYSQAVIRKYRGMSDREIAAHFNSVEEFRNQINEHMPEYEQWVRAGPLRSVPTVIEHLGSRSTPDEIRATVSALPPVQSGYARMFHGGGALETAGAPTTGGGRWVAQDPVYAAHYRQGGKLYYTDVPITDLKEAFDRTGIEDSVKPSYMHKELPEHQAQGLKPVFKMGDTKVTKPLIANLIDHIEGRSVGVALDPNSPFAPLADALRSIHEGLRNEIETQFPDMTGFHEDYYRHLWTDAKAAEGIPGAGRQGSSGSLRERVIPTISRGLELGLTPKILDPIENTLHYAAGMSRYIAARRILDDAREAGYVKYSTKATVDFPTQINGVAATLPAGENGIQRAYAAPGFGAPYNNWLGRGFYDHELGGKIYGGLQYVSNIFTATKLAWWGYHAFNIAKETGAAQLTNGLGEIMRGDLVEGLKHMGYGAGVLPAAVDYLAKGAAFQKKYLDLQNNDPVVQILTEAGFNPLGRRQRYEGPITSPDIQAAARGASYMQMVRRGQIWDTLRREIQHIGGEPEDAAGYRAVMAGPRAAGFMINQIARVFDAINAPVFDAIIPKIKTGAAAAELEAFIRGNPATPRDQLVAAARKISDSMDDRFGEMNQDNLFWPRMIKQLLNVAVVSVGWEYGTVRAFGGAAKDWFNGDVNSTRARWLIAYPAMMSMMNSLYQYLRTGSAPWQTSTPMRDLITPRTGGAYANRYGTVPERAVLPGYEKDVMQTYKTFRNVPDFTRIPGNMADQAMGKLNPFWQSIRTTLSGVDPIGNQIYHMPDPPFQTWGMHPGVANWLRFMGDQLTPIVAGNALDQKPGSNIPAIERVFGIRPAGGFFQNEPGAIEGMEHHERTLDKQQRRRTAREANQ